MKSSPPRVARLTWEEIEKGIAHAATRMRDDGKMLNGVYGIPRGGCCIAVIFSHLLGIEYLSAPRPGCLIVDDIADTGNTLMQYEDYPCTTFTAVAKEASKVHPDYCGMFIPEGGKDSDAWVESPWEQPK